MIKDLIFDSIIDRVIEPILVIDEFSRVAFVNDSFTKLTGWSLDQIQGHNEKQILQVIDQSGENDLITFDLTYSSQRHAIHEAQQLSLTSKPNNEHYGYCLLINAQDHQEESGIADAQMMVRDQLFERINTLKIHMDTLMDARIHLTTLEKDMLANKIQSMLTELSDLITDYNLTELIDDGEIDLFFEKLDLITFLKNEDNSNLNLSKNKTKEARIEADPYYLRIILRIWADSLNSFLGLKGSQINIEIEKCKMDQHYWELRHVLTLEGYDHALCSEKSMLKNNWGFSFCAKVLSLMHGKLKIDTEEQGIIFRLLLPAA